MKQTFIIVLRAGSQYILDDRKFLLKKISTDEKN